MYTTILHVILTLFLAFMFVRERRKNMVFEKGLRVKAEWVRDALNDYHANAESYYPGVYHE